MAAGIGRVFVSEGERCVRVITRKSAQAGWDHFLADATFHRGSESIFAEVTFHSNYVGSGNSERASAVQ